MYITYICKKHMNTQNAITIVQVIFGKNSNICYNYIMIFSG